MGSTTVLWVVVLLLTYVKRGEYYENIIEN